MFHHLIKAIWMASLVFGVSSCSNLTEYSDTVISKIPVVNCLASTNYCTIKIKSSKCTNNGAPFYALVKSTDFPTFLTDDYSKIANLVSNPPEGEACFEVFCIVPGKDQAITIAAPEVKSLGVYFLFTTPGTTWKQILELEEGCPTIKIVLDNNEIGSVMK